VNDDFEMTERKVSGWLLQGFVDTHPPHKRYGSLLRMDNAPAHPRLHTLHKRGSVKDWQNLYHHSPTKPKERSGNSRCNLAVIIRMELIIIIMSIVPS